MSYSPDSPPTAGKSMTNNNTEPIASSSADDTPPNRWLLLSICCMSLFIVGTDVSGLNLALPSIKRDLNVSQSNLQ